MIEKYDSKGFYKLPMQLFDIQGKGYHLFVKAKYNNLELNFLIDSGASLSLFDFSKIGDFTIETTQSDNSYEAQGVGDKIESYVKIFDTLEISGKEIKNYEAIAIDLSELNNMFDLLKKPHIDGILGADTLFDSDAMIDFQNGEMLFDNEKIPLSIDSYQGGAKHVFVEIVVDGSFLRMALDTAASHTVFDIGIVEEKLNSKISLWELNNEPNVGLGKLPSDKQIILKNIDFFNDCVVDLQLFQLDLTTVNEKYKSLNIPEIHGILGCDWLLKNSSIIDFQKLNLLIKKQQSS